MPDEPKEAPETTQWKIEPITDSAVVLDCPKCTALPLLVGLAAFYFSHRWIYGPEIPLNKAILIPVFIAVAAYTITKPRRREA